MSTPISYYELIDTFPAGGCAVCKTVRKSLDQYLDSLLYEYANTRDTHRDFRAGRGLCNIHSWQLLDYNGSSLGVAILYRAVADELLKLTESAARISDTSAGLGRLLGRNTGGGNVADGLEPSISCIACEFMTGAEARIMQTLVQNLEDTRFREALRASDGLCLPHLRQALRESKPSQQQTLLTIQRESWQRLKAELTEFIDKSSHDRRAEQMGAERDSWQRAIGRIAGEPNVFGLDKRRR